MACNTKLFTYTVVNPTVLPFAAPNTYTDNIFTQCTVINNTDQDVIFVFKTMAGVDCEAIVPKSIKAYSIQLGGVDVFMNSSIKLKAVTTDAIGKVHFNFAT